MRFLLLVFVLTCSTAFASNEKEFSSKDLIEYFCLENNYFNPRACVDSIYECVNSYPIKSLKAKEKLGVINHCISHYSK